jgi:hypothetical protein
MTAYSVRSMPRPATFCGSIRPFQGSTGCRCRSRLTARIYLRAVRLGCRCGSDAERPQSVVPRKISGRAARRGSLCFCREVALPSTGFLRMKPGDAVPFIALLRSRRDLAPAAVRGSAADVSNGRQTGRSAGEKRTGCKIRERGMVEYRSSPASETLGQSSLIREAPYRPRSGRVAFFATQKSGFSAVGTAGSFSVLYLCGFSAQTCSGQSRKTRR